MGKRASLIPVLYRDLRARRLRRWRACGLRRFGRDHSPDAKGQQAREKYQFHRRWIIIPLVVLTTVCVLSLIVAGVTSLISLADRIHPVAGTIVFWSFFLAAGFFTLYCVIAYARLPAALIPPEETSGPRHDAYLQALRARLAINPRTRDLPLATPEEIERAVGHLSNEADKVVRRTASTVFLSTALMQNGRLDGLVVLFTQIQMVNRVARIYVQRPSPRELMRLYANVAGTALIASGLESLDLGEMIAPLATSVVPAIKGGIPGSAVFQRFWSGVFRMALRTRF